MTAPPIASASERAATSLRLRALDLRDRLCGRADRLTPPRRLDFVGHSDFQRTGDEFLTYFADLAHLREDERVLDVGCGIGRMARPLTRYLGAAGSYDGFDVNRAGIGWCRRRYKRFPNFRFQVADLYNQRYNPSGRHRAAEYRFPFEDASFDVAILTSVLTHLLPEECEHYVAEVARVLAPGGRMLATFFLLDDETRARIADGRSGLAFLDATEPVAVVDETVPEEAVAYGDDWVRDALGRHGLAIVSVHPGSWSGREDFMSFQDVVVAIKEPEPVG